MDTLVGPAIPGPSSPLTMRETFELARTFVIVWFLANWTVNSSLRYTTVASATILASTSGAFVRAAHRT